MRYIALVATLILSFSAAAQVQPARTIDMTIPFSAAAQVQSARTIDMTIVLHDQNGKPLKDAAALSATALKADPDCEKCPILTLGRLVADVLYGVQNRDDRGQVTDSAMVLGRRGLLAEKIRDDKAAVLTTEQITDIKELVAKGFPMSNIIVQVYPLLDPNEKFEDKK